MKKTPSQSTPQKQIKVGDYVTFGHYPQTADGSDQTPVEWLVLKTNSNQALILSRYALNFHSYHTSDSAVTWEKCELRAWMNDTLLNQIFSSEEQESIVTTTVSTSSYKGNSGGADTKDKLWLLSKEEVNQYLDKKASQTTPTAYAAGWNSDNDGTESCEWWLRSPGFFGDCAMTVQSSGDTSDGAFVDSQNIAVRPALWVKMEVLQQ